MEVNVSAVIWVSGIDAGLNIWMHTQTFIWLHTFKITHLPGYQDSLILLQLSHEWWVGFGDGSSLFNILKGLLHVPAVLLHGICNHSGGRTTNAHLTMHQTFCPCFPVGIILVLCKKIDVVLVLSKFFWWSKTKTQVNKQFELRLYLKPRSREKQKEILNLKHCFFLY